MRLRAIALAGAVIGAALFFLPAMQAQAYPPTTCPGMLSVSTTTPLAGETITVTGADFTAGAQVHLVMHSKAFDLGTFKADSQGGFTAQVTLPEGVTGAHVILATSGAPHIGQCAGVHIRVHAPAGTSAGPPGHGTSFTGVDILLVVLIAVGLLGAGAALTRGGKRRHGPTAG